MASTDLCGDSIFENRESWLVGNSVQYSVKNAQAANLAEMDTGSLELWAVVHPKMGPMTIL